MKKTVISLATAVTVGVASLSPAVAEPVNPEQSTLGSADADESSTSSERDQSTSSEGDQSSSSERGQLSDGEIAAIVLVPIVAPVSYTHLTLPTKA